MRPPLVSIPRSSFVVMFLAALWLGAIAWGFRVLWLHTGTPGPASPIPPPPTWNPSWALKRQPGRHALILFAHPKCPCTRATMTEFARLMSGLHGRVDALVYCYRPAGPEAWDGGWIWDRAGQIEGVARAFDEDGRIAAAAGATTSGHTLLYDPAGNLVYSGGLTAARGHEGESLGQKLINDFVMKISRERGAAPVYGCSLRDPVSQVEKGNPDDLRCHPSPAR